MGISFWFGMTLVYNDVRLSVGNMMSSFFCVLTAGFTIGQIPPGCSGLVNAIIFMARFFHIKEHDSHIQRQLKEYRKECGPIQTIQLDNVHFSYLTRPDVRVLNGLSMSTKKGQKVAVVGESCSGKSTVMALLERFFDPSTGQFLVNGESLIGFSVKSIRRQIGYVGQEPVLCAATVRKTTFFKAVRMQPRRKLTRWLPRRSLTLLRNFLTNMRPSWAPEARSSLWARNSGLQLPNRCLRGRQCFSWQGTNTQNTRHGITSTPR